MDIHSCISGWRVVGTSSWLFTFCTSQIDSLCQKRVSSLSLYLSLPSSAIQESQEFTFTLQFTCFFYFSIFVHPRDDNFTHSLMRNVKYQCSSIGKHIFRFYSHIKVEMIREMKIVLNYAHFIRFLNSNCDFCMCVCLWVKEKIILMDIPMIFIFISQDLSLSSFIKYKAMC